MGRIVPPNWGRSFPMKSLLGAENEFVRVDIAEARDITIVMGNPECMKFALDFRPEIKLDFGQGATTMQMVVDPTQLGRVIHVVTKTLVVRATLMPSEGSTPDITYSVIAGIGRPKEERITTRISIQDNAPPWLVLEPWTYAVSIAPWNVPADPTLAAVLNKQVVQGTYDKATDSYHPHDDQTSNTVADYATPRPLDPDTNMIGIEVDPSGAKNYLITQYRQL